MNHAPPLPSLPTQRDQPALQDGGKPEEVKRCLRTIGRLAGDSPWTQLLSDKGVEEGRPCYSRSLVMAKMVTKMSLERGKL